MKIVLNSLIFLNNFYEKYRFNNYYLYYKSLNIIDNISLIVWILNLPFIGKYLVNDVINISNDKILIYDNGKNLKKYKEEKYDKLQQKILKNLIYKDDSNEIILDDLKKNIVKIDQDINLEFILNLINNIKINENSILEVEYFFGSAKKVINLNSDVLLREIYI